MFYLFRFYNLSIMGFVFDKKQQSIIQILNGTKKDIAENIELLAAEYLKQTGRNVCRSCPSDIQYMILTLKSKLKMTQFKFKRAVAQYKNKKGDKTTISNATMTDEKAIEFLRTNPERIKLFSEYPSNWETLIIDGAGSETEEEKDARLAAEAELKTVENAKEETKEISSSENKADDAKVEETEAGESESSDDAIKAAEAEAAKAAEDAVESEEKPKREDLERMKLSELREKYPEVKATSIKEFVDKVLE